MNTNKLICQKILAWGLRNMKKFQLSDIECPQCIFEIGEHKIETEVLRNVKRSLNFNKPVLYLDIVKIIFINYEIILFNKINN